MSTNIFTDFKNIFSSEHHSIHPKQKRNYTQLFLLATNFLFFHSSDFLYFTGQSHFGAILRSQYVGS